jgi:hypothetical protein
MERSGIADSSTALDRIIGDFCDRELARFFRTDLAV